jgi:hypothetical protein
LKEAKKTNNIKREDNCRAEIQVLERLIEVIRTNRSQLREEANRLYN